MTKSWNYYILSHIYEIKSWNYDMLNHIYEMKNFKIMTKSWNYDRCEMKSQNWQSYLWWKLMTYKLIVLT